MLFSFIEYIFGVIFRCVFVYTRLNATHSQHEKQSKRQIKRFSLWICVLSWSTIVFGLAIVYMLLDFSVLSKLFSLFLIFCCCYFSSQFRYLSIRFECFMLFPTNSKAHRSQSDAFCVSPSNSKHDIRTKIMLTLSWHLCNAKNILSDKLFPCQKKDIFIRRSEKRSIQMKNGLFYYRFGIFFNVWRSKWAQLTTQGYNNTRENSTHAKEEQPNSRHVTSRKASK